MAERWMVLNEGEPRCLHPRVQSQFGSVVGRQFEARRCLDCRRELRRPFTPPRVTMPKV